MKKVFFMQALILFWVQFAVAQNKTNLAINPYRGMAICQTVIGSQSLSVYCPSIQRFGDFVTRAALSNDVVFTTVGKVAKNTNTIFFANKVVPAPADDDGYWDAVNEARRATNGTPQQFTTAEDHDYFFWGHPHAIRIPAGSRVYMSWEVLKPANGYHWFLLAFNAEVSRDTDVPGIGIAKKGQSILTVKSPYAKGDDQWMGKIAIR